MPTWGVITASSSVLLLLIISPLISVQCFTIGQPSFTSYKTAFTTNNKCTPKVRSSATTTTAVKASSSSKYASKNRESILSRENGQNFAFNRFTGKVEFGSTANLITKLESTNQNVNTIRKWISNVDQIATSIWDRNLLTNLGNSVYRLQLMDLKFISIGLAPHVDTYMWTTVMEDEEPLFQLQSVDFNPNIKVMGLNVSPSSLKIQIEVVGEMRPSKDGTGVTGKIGFVTSGKLPPPMVILPDIVLKQAGGLISSTVTKFVVRSFEKGAIASYREFRNSAAAQQE